MAWARKMLISLVSLVLFFLSIISVEIYYYSFPFGPQCINNDLDDHYSVALALSVNEIIFRKYSLVSAAHRLAKSSVVYYIWPKSFAIKVFNDRCRVDFNNREP